MPYGPPPNGWYPHPGQGFPPGPPGQFPPYGYPPGPPGQNFQPNQGPQPSKPAPIGPGANKATSPLSSASDKQPEPKSLAKPAAEMAAAAVPVEAPKETRVQAQLTPPAANVDENKAPASQTPASQNTTSATASKANPIVPKSNRVQPVIPLKSPLPVKAPLQPPVRNPTQTTQATSTSLKDSTQAATAAVAAAMAKLPATGGQTNGNAMDNLTKKVNEMRTNDPVRAPRQPVNSGERGGFERGRGRGRGGPPRNPAQKVEVPETDFDFESSNAKFSKQDLVKEAIAGSPLGEQPSAASPVEPDAVPAYSKTTSFFDNISSESKDRQEANGGRPGGREWRGEEQKKNVETFGQGSVDNGYRGGFRGRGRGRGRGFRSRGGYGGGNGQPTREGSGYRGNQGDQ